MITRTHRRNFLFGLVAAFSLLLDGKHIPPAQAQPGGGNLPVYTSPIDVTGLKVVLRAVAPDRDTGQPIDVALPAGLLGPKMNQLFATPLSSQIDQYWNATPDPKTKMTARQAACDGPDGITQQVAKQVATIGSSYSAYDISCNLAAKGQLVVKQVGSTLYLGYLLTNNTVSFASTSPDTCRKSTTSFACLNDPRFTVHFATEIETVVRTPSLCQLNAEQGTVYVQSASIESQNAAASIGKFFKDQKFLAAELAISSTVRSQPLPLDDDFKELRTGDACTGKLPGVSRLLVAFRQLDTVIDPRQGIVLRATHAGIAAPILSAPNPGFVGPVQPPSVPSFTRPTISTSQPLVTAGHAIQTSGIYFPLATDYSTALPVTMRHGGYGANSDILGGVCFGGETDFDWGPVGAPFHLVKLQGGALGACAPSFDAVNLTPSTAYQFRARDCDPITCSPWSATLRSTTARVDPGKATVVLALDGGTPLGTATVSAQGTFTTTITIPAGTAIGAHMIHAVNGTAKADVAIQVTAPSPPGGGNASIMMVGLLAGESGCPNHPITSTQTDATFTLFGAGFAAGVMTLHLDNAGGLALGMATVRADGSICQVMKSAPRSLAGAHTLVAVQNGAVVAQKAVTFVPPTVIH